MIHQLDGAIHRHGGDVHLVLVDGRKRAHGIPARQQNQRRAGKQRKDQTKVLASDPELREERQEDAVLVRNHRDALIGGGGINHVALRMDAALRHAGRPAGVVQRSDIIESCRWQRRWSRNRGQCRQQVRCTGNRDARTRNRLRNGNRRICRHNIRKARHDDFAQLGLAPHLIDRRRELIERNDHFCIGVVQFIGEFECTRERADRDVDRAELENAEEHDVKLRTIRQEHCNAIALANAFGLQQCREAIALLIEIGISRHVTVENHRRPLWPVLRPGTQILGQRDLAMRVMRLARNALRPVLLPQGMKLRQIILFSEARGHILRPSCRLKLNVSGASWSDRALRASTRRAC